MLKILRYNKKSSLRTLETILNKRKSKQKNQSSSVRRIIRNVKKNGDKAVHVIGATNASVNALGSEITDIEQKKHKVEKARIIPLTN